MTATTVRNWCDSFRSNARSLLLNLALAATGLSGMVASQDAFAASAPGTCEIGFNGLSYFEGATNSTSQAQFVILGTCGSAVSGTVTVGGTLTPLNASQLSWSGVSGDTFSIDFQLGPVNGVYDSIRVDCTSGCDTSGTSLLNFDVITDTIYSLLPQGPTTLSIAPGASQVLTVRQLQNGYPASDDGDGEFTYWSASPGGTLASNSVQNDTIVGDASNTFSASVAGVYTVTVTGVCSRIIFKEASRSSVGNPSPQATICPPSVVFTINVVTPTLAITGGNNQTALTGVAYADPLTVQALNDGIAAAGVDINWALTSGNALLSATSATTAGSGQASITVTPTTPEGTIKITASRADAPAVKQVFTLRSTTDRTISVVSGNNQSGLTNSALPQALVVNAKDNGIDAVGANILWQVQSGDATVSAANTTTDNAGDTSISVTFGATPGRVVILAKRAENPAAIAFFTLTSLADRTLAIVDGDGQTGPTGTALPVALAVVAQDDGANVQDANIAWSVVSGSASLSNSNSRTDAAGQASSTVTLGPVDGPIVISATRQGPTPITVLFNLSSTTARTLAIASGNNQTGATGTAVTNPLVVLAQDNGLNASGKTINWSVTGSATLGASSSVTDASGNASVSVTFGATPGTVTVTGTRADDAAATVSFTLTSTLTRTLAIASGNNQTGATGTAVTNPLVVLAQDNGVNASGKTINWSVTGSATLGASSSITDGSGNASVSVTFGATPGSVTVTGTRADDAAATVSFTLTSSAPLPSTLTVVSGNGQSGLTQTAADAPLVVLLRDGSGTPISGSTITWQVVSGPATLASATSTTDATGQSNIGFSFGDSAGNIVLRASALSGTVSVDFSALSQFATLGAASGDGQSGPVSQQLPLPLQVQVNLPAPRQELSRDGGASPQSLAGVVVQWQVMSGGGTISTSSSITDASGRASTTLTLGPNAGANSVKATVAGGSNITFNATGTTAVVTRTLEILDGNNQSGIVGETLPLPLDVMARNDGNGQSGVGITWAVTSGSATLSSTSTTTDSDGESDISVELGATAGPITVTATRVDEAAATVTFNLTANPEPGVPVLTVVSGDGQRGLYQTDGDAPLVVRLQDGNGQPMAGETITWVKLGGPVSLDQSSSTTDSNGLASVGFSFGSQAGTSQVTATLVDEEERIIEASFTLYTENPYLVIVSGNNQSGLPGNSLSEDFVVEVNLPDERGAGGSIPQSLAGLTITWQVEEGGGSLTTYSSTTDAQGRARTRLQLGPQAGLNSVSASVGSQGCENPSAKTAGKYYYCYSDSVTFEADAVEPDNELVIVSGNNQSANTGAALTEDFVVRVRPVNLGSRGNGSGSIASVAGIEVRWDIVNGDGSLSSTSTLTDASGQAAVRYTLGSDSGAHVVQASIGDDGGCGGRGKAFCDNTSSVSFYAYALDVVSLTAITPTTVTLAVGETTTLGVSYLVNGEDADDTTHWSVSPTGPTLGASSVATDGEGEARNTFRSNVAGTFVVRVMADCNYDKAPSTSAQGGKVYNSDCPDDIEFTINVENRDLTTLPGLTPQQEAVAGAINEFCPRLAGIASNDPDFIDLRQRCNELFSGMGSDPDGVIKALDEMYSDLAVVQSLSSLLAAQTQFDNIKARIAALRSGTQGTDFGGLAFSSGSGNVPLGAMFQNLIDGGDGKTGEAGSDFSRWGFFASGIVGRGDSDQGLLNPGYDFDIRGLTAGVDYRKSDKWIFGATVGYNRQDNQLAGGEGSLETSGWSLSAFTTYYLSNSWYTDAVLSWGNNSYEMLRKLSYSITPPGGPTTTIEQFGRSSSGGDSLSFASSVGRDFNKGAWGFGPYARILYSKLTFDTITETMTSGQPGSGLALVIDTQDVTSLSTVVGGKMTYTYSTSWGVVIPHFQFEWQHEHKDDPSRVEAHFLHDPTATPFLISGDAVDKDFYRLGAGLSMLFAKGRSGFFYWERMIGREGTHQDNFAFGLRMEF